MDRFRNFAVIIIIKILTGCNSVIICQKISHLAIGKNDRFDRIFMIRGSKIPDIGEPSGIVIHIFRLLACAGEACGEDPILGIDLLSQILYIFLIQKQMRPKKL